MEALFPPPPQHCSPLKIIKDSIISILASFHAGYFRISLSLCSQALLWKILGDQSIEDAHALRRVFQMLPSTAFLLIWSIALFTVTSLSLLYILRCLVHFEMVKLEFLHHVGVNYLFAPWISWLLLLQSSPFFTPKTMKEVFVNRRESDESTVGDREPGGSQGGSSNGVERDLYLHVFIRHGTLSCAICHLISKIKRGKLCSSFSLFSSSYPW
uniref:Uncharacterized protein n=1 Tax=Manihot esculenta TaxID=3983 RepID=A0A199U9X0_MANES